MVLAYIHYSLTVEPPIMDTSAPILSIRFYIPPKKGQPLNNGQNALLQFGVSTA